MKNKKYRDWKLILVLIVSAIIAFSMIPIANNLIEKIMLAICGAIFTIGLLILSSLYLEIKDDRIVTRLGVTSLYKEYRGSLKKHIFMFDDLRDIYVENNTTVHMTFKGGKAATFDIGGFFKKQEIISLIYEVRAQIKGYEQVYVNND